MSFLPRSEPSMRFGFRRLSLRKRLAARTSWKRVVRHSLGLKAPRGWGWLTKPAARGLRPRLNRTTRRCLVFFPAVLIPSVLTASELIELA